VFKLLISLLRHKRLVKDFVIRDLKARYVGSSMGFFWSVVFPIINLFVYMFVFRMVLNARWGDSQGALEVAVVMLCGIVIWTAFAETISRATNTLVDNANLIQKVVFPSEVLPVYLTLSSLINMCIGLPVVLLSVLWVGHLSLPDVYITVPLQEAIGADGKPQLDANEHVMLEPVDIRLGEDQEPYRLTLNITRGRYAPVRVPFTLSGTAVEGEDYHLATREAVIEPGYVKWHLYITPINDGLVEGDESIVIELQEPEGAHLLPQSHDLGVGADRRLELTLKDLGEAPAKAPAMIHVASGPSRFDPTYHPLKLGSSLLALPVLFLLQVIFTVGLGFFLSAFNLFLRDTYHLVGVGITVWMFATPIFYPGWMVADKGFGWMLLINPMHWMIDMYRGVLLHGLWPQAIGVIKLAMAAGVSLFLGASFFRAHSKKFPDLL
jgi:ABC-type polysaccharide/polyol phosphate export permease